MIDFIIMGSVLLLLVLLTVYLLTGRGANLIAGFNTLSKGEKEDFDKPALCRFVGKALIPFNIALAVLFLGILFDGAWTAWAGIAVGVAGVPYVIALSVYANTGNRFKK